MDKCVVKGCPGTASKESPYCLTCEQIWGGIQAGIIQREKRKRTMRQRTTHMDRIVCAYIALATVIGAAVIALGIVILR